MAVQEQTPYVEYVANGITTNFALEFDCENQDHLIVSIDDLEVLHTDWYLSGNAIVFHVAPASGKQVKIQRNTPFNRLADYQSYNNSFRPPAINKEFDRIWWKLQELGVADWILGARIDALKNYVDDRDDELRAYLIEEIRKQGVALDQLDGYYNYLMQRLAQIAVDKGWDASFVVDGGKNQKQINAQVYAKLARTVYVNDYGDVGNGQEASAAFQAAVNAAGVGGTVLFDGKGEYLLSVPTYILDKQEINGNGALLINNFDRSAYPRGTLQGLMQYGYNAAGGYTNLVGLGASTAITSFLSYTVNITSTANVSVGDMINIGMLSALVVAKTATTLTLDRFATYNIPSGTAVYKVNYLSNIYIHDFEIDFNGTVANPRWGYGVLGHAGLNCRTENIKSKYVGSKVVEYTRSISCNAKNIYNFVGTDNFGTGGHGYVVRFGGATDSCIAENVSGTDVRHTIDISGGQRNKSYNCEAFLNTSSSFLTHGLESHYSEFIDCNSYGAIDSAYHINSGDKNCAIRGGYVNGRMFIGNTNFDETTTFDGITIENSQAISPIGRTVFKNCKFLFKPSQLSAMFRYSGAENAEVVFNNCEFIFEVGAIANALVASNGTGKVKFVLNNPIIRVLGINIYSTFKAGDIIEFNGGSIDVVQTNSTTDLFSSAGIIKAKDVRCSFETSGLYFFGKSASTSVLSLEGCTFSNANGVWRSYAVGSKVILGRNVLNNSSYLSLSNTNLGTIGIANNIAYPPSGTWDIGSRIVNPAPIAGGYAEYIMTAGGWKGVSAIEA